MKEWKQADRTGIMNKDNKQFYMVDFQILPAAIKKTIRTKELLKSGAAETINAAVAKTGISRSAYYKYKDHVASAFEDPLRSTTALFIIVQNDSAVINKIFRRIGKGRAEIVSMNLGVPIKKLTTLTLSLRTGEMQISFAEMTQILKSIKGVKDVTVIEEK